jgi:hypothetical protein
MAGVFENPNSFYSVTRSLLILSNSDPLNPNSDRLNSKSDRLNPKSNNSSPDGALQTLAFTSVPEAANVSL